MRDWESKFRRGTIVGNYVLSEKIGTGRTGSVYRGHHRLLSYEAAIKINQHHTDNEIIGVAFLQSANCLSQLSHPNIVRLYDYGSCRGHAYIAMEYIQGQPLDKLTPKVQTKEWVSSSVEYFLHVLSAVRYAHNSVYLDLAGEQAEGIIHGDIKSRNILIDQRSGQAKLTDFMIPDAHEHLGKEIPTFERPLASYTEPLTQSEKASLVREMEENDEIKEYFGTPAYMPPENREGKLSIQANIYMLGATLYETVTCRQPRSLFQGLTPRRVN